MNKKLIVGLAFAFVLAIAASFVVYRVVSRQASGQKLTTQVVIADRDLEVGSAIKDGDVKLGDVVGAPSPGVLTRTDAAIGRGVISPIFAGDTINDARLAKVGAGAGLAALIPPGMRACAVKVNEVVGVAGFAVPGMRVDVLLAGRTPGASGQEGTQVKTLLQNIEVLSAGKNFRQDAEGKPAEVTVVNLLVTPEQAEILSLTNTNEARIQLVLRNPTDREIAMPPGADMANLFNRTAPKPASSGARPTPRRAVAAPPQPPAAPQPHIVQMIVGGKQSQQALPTQGERQ